MWDEEARVQITPHSALQLHPIPYEGIDVHVHCGTVEELPRGRAALAVAGPAPLSQDRPPLSQDQPACRRAAVARLQFFPVPPEGKLRSRTGPGGPARGALPLAAPALPE